MTLGRGSCRISLYIAGVVVNQETFCSIRSSQNDLGEYLGGKLTAPEDLKVASKASRPAT